MVNSRIHGRHRHSFWNEIYEIVLAPYILMPTILALINPKWGKFNVTAKESTVEGSYFDWLIAKPFAIMIFLDLIGIVIGVRRFWLEGDPQGVLTVNLSWALFNMLMIGGAMAVANESRQVRSSVRIYCKLAMKILLSSGETIAGQTDNLSLGGVEARVVKSGSLTRGDFAKLELFLAEESYILPVRIVTTSGSMLRMSFTELDLSQQAMLTRIIFARADAWVDWGADHGPDRPLWNLVKIMGISIRGMWVAIRSLFPARKPKKSATPKGKAQVALPLIALLMMLAWAAPLTAQAPMPTFRDVRDLGSVGHRQGSAPARPGQSLHHVLRPAGPRRWLRKPASHSGIEVSAAVAPGSKIAIALNGAPAGTISIQGSGDSSRVLQTELTLSPDLFVAENSITFEYTGVCGSGCAEDDVTDLWTAVEPSTEVRTTGTLLPMPNRLGMLPAPFVGPTAQRVADVPVVLDTVFDAHTLEAAGVAASWFGMKADYNGPSLSGERRAHPWRQRRFAGSSWFGTCSVPQS